MTLTLTLAQTSLLTLTHTSHTVIANNMEKRLFYIDRLKLLMDLGTSEEADVVGTDWLGLGLGLGLGVRVRVRVRGYG
jgi:hypothetical protein